MSGPSHTIPRWPPRPRGFTDWFIEVTDWNLAGAPPPPGAVGGGGWPQISKEVLLGEKVTCEVISMGIFKVTTPLGGRVVTDWFSRFDQ